MLYARQEADALILVQLQEVGVVHLILKKSQLGGCGISQEHVVTPLALIGILHWIAGRGQRVHPLIEGLLLEGLVPKTKDEVFRLVVTSQETGKRTNLSQKEVFQRRV